MSGRCPGQLPLEQMLSATRQHRRRRRHRTDHQYDSVTTKNPADIALRLPCHAQQRRSSGQALLGTCSNALGPPHPRDVCSLFFLSATCLFLSRVFCTFVVAPCYVINPGVTPACAMLIRRPGFAFSTPSALANLIHQAFLRKQSFRWERIMLFIYWSIFSVSSTL